MDRAVLDAFAQTLAVDRDLPEVLVKLAKDPQYAPAQGYEHMTPASWKQTAKDLPAVILASGLGYGAGRTATWALGNHLETNGKAPAWLEYLPAAMAVGGGLSRFGQGHIRQMLKSRRDEANRKAQDKAEK